MVAADRGVAPPEQRAEGGRQGAAGCTTLSGPDKRGGACQRVLLRLHVNTESVLLLSFDLHRFSLLVQTVTGQITNVKRLKALDVF